MWGSAIDSRREHDPAAHARLAATLVALFPVVAGAEVTHRWGGVLAVPRDWRPSIGVDRANGLAWAGGYVGEGVAASNLAGRTLADLILGRATDLTTLPWVGHRSRRWEPEPLRWLGITTTRRVMELADRTEARHGRPSRIAATVARLIR
jgi:glycine/D-amino acid oxidase-like deaminating enzyme